MNMHKGGVMRLVVWIALVLAGFGVGPAWGEDTGRPPASRDIVVSDAWVQEPIPGKSLTSAYFLLRNTGEHPRQLVGVQADFAGRAELHSQEMKDGMVRMRRQESVTIAPRSELRFKSGGYHLMLFDLQRRLRRGENLELMLKFADGSHKRVTAEAISVFDRPRN